MASLRETKKKIKEEYRKLEEDILHHAKVTTNKDLSEAKKILLEANEACNAFVKEMTDTTEKTNTFFIDLSKRVVDDVDKSYNALKDLVNKK